jgi:hypothetical protein
MRFGRHLILLAWVSTDQEGDIVRRLFGVSVLSVVSARRELSKVSSLP